MRNQFNSSSLFVMQNSEIKYYPNIKDYLKAINIEGEQKHPDFHILRSKDHMDVLPLEMGPYRADFFMLSLSETLKFNLSIGEVTYDLTGNTITTNGPGQIISVKSNNIDSDDLVFMILFEADFLPFLKNTYDIYKVLPFFNLHLCPVYHLNKEQTESSQDALQKIYEEFQNFSSDSIELIRAHLTIFLLEGKRMLHAGVMTSQSKNRFEEITDQFEQLIKQTESKRQNLNYYADQLRISTVYLSECVKKATGKTAKQIISEYLLLEAKALLKQSNETISFIAFTIGFEDQSNFIKFFKRETGFTPKQFRSKT